MMIEPEPPTPRKDLGSIARIVVRTALGFLIALLLLGIVGPGAFEPLVLLGIGWIGFLARTVPRITWNWDLLGMALLCMAGVLILAHWFLHWLTGQLATSRGLAGSWRWRWTWCAACIVGIAFLVGMAVGGIAHQTAWIASSHESWYEQRGPSPIRSELSQLQWALQSVMDNAKGDLEETRAELKKLERQQRTGPALFEIHQCLLIVDLSGKLAGAILFPRDPSQAESAGSLLYWFQEAPDFLPMSKLPELVRKHQGRLVSL
jgi:hypothetical protein